MVVTRWSSALARTSGVLKLSADRSRNSSNSSGEKVSMTDRMPSLSASNGESPGGWARTAAAITGS
jgi:hypothetical protein